MFANLIQQDCGLITPRITEYSTLVAGIYFGCSGENSIHLTNGAYNSKQSKTLFTFMKGQS